MNFNFVKTFLTTLSILLIGYSNAMTSPQLNNILSSFVESYANSDYFSAISATTKCGANQVNGIAGTLESNGVVLIDANSLFQIGSTSKSFTSVVLLQLADDPQYSNKFSLHDTMNKWFPEYPQWKDVTIIQLMNMTSGIPDYVNDTLSVVAQSLSNPNYYFSPSELVGIVGSMPIICMPGQCFHYSNTNYILLGMLIQKITGNLPTTVIQNRIFNKLHLNNTYFPNNLPATVVPMNQMVKGYAYINFLPAPYSNLNGFYNLTNNSLSMQYTAGGIISTPEDLTTYTEALYHPGILLTANEIKSLTTDYMVSQNPTSNFPNGGQPITQVSSSTPVGYGLGIFNVYNSDTLGSYYMYDGKTLGYASYYAYYPKKNMYTTFMINNSLNFFQDKASQGLIDAITQYTIVNQCSKNFN